MPGYGKQWCTQLLTAGIEIIHEGIPCEEGFPFAVCIVFLTDLSKPLPRIQIGKLYVLLFRKVIPYIFIDNHDLRCLGYREDIDIIMIVQNAVLHIIIDIFRHFLIRHIVIDGNKLFRLFHILCCIPVGRKDIGQLRCIHLFLQRAF